jgi:hypothetical protein
VFPDWERFGKEGEHQSLLSSKAEEGRTLRDAFLLRGLQRWKQEVSWHVVYTTCVVANMLLLPAGFIYATA